MKKIVRLFAVILAIVMMVSSFVGCHKKDEIAYTIGGREFTSAMYSCVLYTAATNARNAIYSYVQESSGDTTKIKYNDYKFDDEGAVALTGTPYVEFVEEQALKVLRQYAAVLNLMEEKGIELDDETEEIAKVQANYYWYYGCDYSTFYRYSQSGYDVSQYFTPYGYFFEPNGVALSTYEQYMIYEYSYNYLFYELYGEGGEKEIPESDLKAYLDEHYALGDSFSYSLTDADGKDLSEDDKKVLTDEANAFIERLNNGESFEVVFKEFEANEKAREEAAKEEADKENDKDEDKTEGDDKEDNKTEDKEENKENDKTEEKEDEKDEDKEDDEYEPADYTSLFGDEESDYASDYFDDVKKLENGKAAVITDTDNKRLVVVQRRDIFEEDNFWLDYSGSAGVMRDNIIYTLKNEEYDDDLTELGNSYDAKEDKFATSPFDVKDLVFDLE